MTRTRHRAARLESGIDLGQREEAANQQARAGEQHDRERHFRDDESRAQPLRLPSAAAAASAFLQSLQEMIVGGLQRRNQAEHQAGEQRRAEREPHDGAVQADLVDARQIRGPRGDQRLRAPVGERQAERAADQAEQDRLR